jgi:hypothetical protein
METKIKEDGGLGVLDLKSQNDEATSQEFPQIFQQSRHPLGSSYLGKW